MLQEIVLHIYPGKLKDAEAAKDEEDAVKPLVQNVSVAYSSSAKDDVC